MNRFLIFPVVILLTALLQGCSNTPRIADSWPADIPEVAYYEDTFAADVDNQQHQDKNDYLLWVVRFYDGWAFYPRGWKWLIDEVDSTVSDKDRAQMLQLMTSLGEKISAEWSKDRRARTVNTTHLLIWGDALKLAVKDSSQLELANRISLDVDELLERRLQPDDINLDRYFGAPEGATTVAREEGADAFDDPFET